MLSPQQQATLTFLANTRFGFINTYPQRRISLGVLDGREVCWHPNTGRALDRRGLITITYALGEWTIAITDTGRAVLAEQKAA